MAVVITGSNTPTAGGITYGDGTTYATTAAGSSGQALLSAGAGAPTWGTPSTSTTATNLAAGSNGTIPYQSAAGTTQMLAVGSSGQYLKTNGVGAPSWATVSAGFTLATPVATTSGTAVDFTGIPAGTKQIIVMFSGVSTNTSSRLIIQLGDAGGIETSGYVSTSTKIAATVSTQADTTGFIVTGPNTAAANIVGGSVTISLQNSSTFGWVSTGLINAGNEASVFASAGVKSLSAVLDRLQITTLGGDTFDAGEINIAYI